jgi:hypothetical protein
MRVHHHPRDIKPKPTKEDSMIPEQNLKILELATNVAISISHPTASKEGMAETVALLYRTMLALIESKVA